MAARKTRKAPAAKPPGRVRKMIGLDADLARRLATYAAWHGRDQSDVVAEALGPILQGFYAGQRSSQEPAPTIEPAGPRLAVAAG
jgi:hypothetical protein